uniref:hypothetical protein n=1 Tax=Flavobacterium sp. TaxID=239 RepID=UPI004049A077
MIFIISSIYVLLKEYNYKGFEAYMESKNFEYPLNRFGFYLSRFMEDEIYLSLIALFWLSLVHGFLYRYIWLTKKIKAVFIGKFLIHFTGFIVSYFLFFVWLKNSESYDVTDLDYWTSFEFLEEFLYLIIIVFYLGVNVTVNFCFTAFFVTMFVHHRIKLSDFTSFKDNKEL